MKTLVLSLVLLAPTLVVCAQDDVFSNKTNAALEKVIRDFPNRFHNIRGEQIAQKPQTVEYRSNIQVPGAGTCFITKVSKEETYSWTCSALTSKDFAMARSRYQEIYDQIENTIIKIDGQKPFIVSGQYHIPYESRNLNSVVFDLLPSVGDMKKLKIELNLVKDPTGWKVMIRVYDEDHKIESFTASAN